MYAEKIKQDYEALTGKQFPEEVDVVAIMYGGCDLAERVNKDFRVKGINTRLLGLIPRNGGCREIGRKSHSAIYSSLIERRKIPEAVSFEDFSSNPRYRFLSIENREIAIPKPENLIVLAEDIIYFGGTIYSVLEDLDQLGYSQENTYICFERGNAAGLWQMRLSRKDFVRYQSLKERKIFSPSFW